MKDEKRTVEDAIRDLASMAREDARILEEEMQAAVSINTNKIEERNRIILATIIDSVKDVDQDEDKKKLTMDIIIEDGENEKKI